MSQSNVVQLYFMTATCSCCAWTKRELVALEYKWSKDGAQHRCRYLHDASSIGKKNMASMSYFFRIRDLLNVEGPFLYMGKIKYCVLPLSDILNAWNVSLMHLLHLNLQKKNLRIFVNK